MRYWLVILSVFNLWLSPLATAASPCAMHEAVSQAHKQAPEAGTSQKNHRGNHKQHGQVVIPSAGHPAISHAAEKTVPMAASSSECECCDDGACQCQSTCHFGASAILFIPSVGPALAPRAQKVYEPQQISLKQHALLPPFRPPIS